MNRQLPLWLVLAFLAAFLILIGSSVFLLQGRTETANMLATREAQLTEQAESLGELDALEAELTAQSAEIENIEATRAAFETENDQLIAQYDTLRQESNSAADALVNSQATATAAALATQEVVADSVPEIEIVSPNEDGGVSGSAINIIVLATDPKGIITVNVEVDGKLVGEFDADDAPVFTAQAEWTPLEPGEYVIEVSAINTNGRASEVVEQTVTIAEAPASEAELRALVLQIQRNVEELRGLQAQAPIELTILTEAELRERLEADFAEETTPEDAQKDVVELYAFDIVPLDYPLYDRLIDVYSQSILGFYDLETSELVVVSDDNELTLLEQLTLAHEITHALQDQNFDFDITALEGEAGFALRALAEGDATLVQQLYVQDGYLSQDEILVLFEEITAQEQSAPEVDFPELLLDQQEFPYSDGFEFVSEIYEGGGFDAVNAAWADPPVSTEQIIHPNRYFSADTPDIVTQKPLTDTLGAGWEFVASDILGEFTIREYLDQEIDSFYADEASAGWGGDRYIVHWNAAEEAVVMVMTTAWDSDEDSDQFTTQILKYLDSKYGYNGEQLGAYENICWQADDVTCFFRDGVFTLVIRAPNVALIDALYDSQR